MKSKPGYRLSFKFAAPDEKTAAIAQSLCKSADPDERLVAETAIEVGELSRKTLADLENAFNPRGGECDLAAYFDRDMTRATEAATRLLRDASDDVKLLAQCVIDQAEAIAGSRKAFLDEVK